MYALIENNAISKYPVGLEDLRRKFPNTSFPKKLEGVDLSEFGVVNVVLPPEPIYNPETQYLRQDDAPTLDSDGVWTLQWQVVNYTDEELANQLANIAAGVRADRNKRLADSDWTQLADNTADTNAWAAYRQALRDLPSTDGFPHNVTWPTEPTT